MIKQKRGNNKTKIIVSLSLVCLMFVAVITAVVLINAFPNQGFGSNIKISYIAKDISAEIRAWYQEKTGSKTYLTTTEGGSETLLKLNANDTSTAPKQLHMDKDITLTSANNYVIFCYEFKNTGSKTIAAEHMFTNAIAGANPENMNISYSRDGINYDTLNTGFSLTFNNTQSYYFKIEVTDLAHNASLHGAIDWILGAIKNNVTGQESVTDPVRIGATSYATFEEAYTVAAAGDIVTISEDVTLSESFAVNDKVTIVAEKRATGEVNATSNDAVTITLSGKVAVDKKDLLIGSFAGNKINLTANKTSIGNLFEITGSGKVHLKNVNFFPATGAESQRAAYVSSANFEMEGGELSNFKHSDGGAIYFHLSNGAFKNVNILNNYSSSFAGALVSHASTITIDGGLINGNSSLQTGGFIYGNKDSKLTVRNCEISNNTTGKSGGAICVEGGRVELYDVDLIENQTKNHSSHGGAIHLGYVEYAGTLNIIHYTQSAYLYYDGGTISGNYSYNAGFLYNNACEDGYGNTHREDPGSVEIKNCIIENNTASEVSLMEQSGEPYTTFENCKITSEINGSVSPSIRLADDYALFKNCEFINVQIGVKSPSGNIKKFVNCKITSIDTEVNQSFIILSGMMELYYNVAVFENCEVYNMLSDYDGAFACVENGRLELKNSKFYNCSSAAGGGVIAQTGGQVDIDNCEIYSNTANSAGGFIYKNDGITNILNSRIYGNTAKGSGGAIHSDGGETVIENTAIYQNESQEGNGSALCANAGIITINGTTNIYNNTASVAGGAIRVGVTAELIMNNGTIQNNQVNGGSLSSASGGGVYVSAGGTFTMNGGTIHNNKVSGTYTFGGNVYVDKAYNTDGVTYPAAIFILNGGTVSGDGSTQQAMVGGGIAVFGEFTMSGGTISGCVAQVGGGIANIGSSSLNGGTISGCVANNDAGNNSRAVANNGTLYLGNITLASGQDLAMGYQKVSSFISTPFPEGYGNLIVCETLTNSYNITFVQVTGTFSAKVSTGTTAINRFTGGTAFATYLSGVTVDSSKFTTSGYTFYVSNGSVYMQ